MKKQISNNYSDDRIMKRKANPLHWLALLALLGLIAASCKLNVKLGSPTPKMQAMENDPKRVAALLTAAGAWILPQPKEAGLTGGSFDLKRPGRARLVGGTSAAAERIVNEFQGLLRERSGVVLKPSGFPILLGIFPDGKPGARISNVSEADLKDLGSEGYVLHVDGKGISAAARSPAGLRHATRTLVQLATDKTSVPGLHIRDWPSMQYRGVMQDISRGQVPTVQALERLTRVLAEAKMNMLELYIESTYKFEAHPDSSPPEGLSPGEARDLFNYAADFGVEVHPLFQVLGHAGTILNNPKDVSMAVRPPKQTWGETYDIRKPETVAFVLEMVRELQDTMPGKLFTVDLTESDIKGFNLTGTPTEKLTRLILDYAVKLQNVLNEKRTRLVIVQETLGAEGELGAYLGQLPKESIVGSYYATTIFNSWDKDFPLLKELKVDFFANPWIYSHIRLMPWAGGAADFSDAEVGKGLLYGAIGSTTCDWGDEGHFHFVGQEWCAVLYHGACAWTGANADRQYFNQSFSRLLYGVKDDSVARAIIQATSIYGKNIPYRDDSGKVIEGDPMNIYLWGFFNDPWANPINTLVSPVAAGRLILDAEEPAFDLMQNAVLYAKRNQDNLEQLMFGIRNYQAMGKKFIASGHYLDAQIPRAKVAQELAEVINNYETSKGDYQRMWLAEDRDNSQYRSMIGWYDRTIVPCKQKIEELRKGGK
jgi:hypothetical protein